MPRNMRALTNFELEGYAGGIPHFRGVFMRDTLPRKPWKNESGIINLNLDSEPGSHWVAYRKQGPTVYYFDSFGDLPPPAEFQKYCKNSEIFYNHRTFQMYNQTNCGQLCLQFLKSKRPKGFFKML